MAGKDKESKRIVLSAILAVAPWLTEKMPLSPVSRLALKTTVPLLLIAGMPKSLKGPSVLAIAVVAPLLKVKIPARPVSKRALKTTVSLSLIAGRVMKLL